MTKSPIPPAVPGAPARRFVRERSVDLETLVHRLPQPQHQLVGRVSPSLLLPDNVVCFQRKQASELNRPRRGRALHHRFVLIYALRTAVTVCVDDQAIRLHPGEGLLVFPFQFHHYIQPEKEGLSWLFVTFELSEVEEMEALRNRPFVVTPGLRGHFQDLVATYETDRTADVTVLLLALLLARLRRAASATPAGKRAPAPAPRLVVRVNQLAHRAQEHLRIQDIARTLGISPSHLRARFRASCGLSIGRHLRRMRLERACGLLRLGQQRVSEVAELCGFTSIYSFSRAFRQAYGVSPMAYRRHDRKKPAKTGSPRRPKAG
jgi:AraC-like DNA-binding protein